MRLEIYREMAKYTNRNNYKSQERIYNDDGRCDAGNDNDATHKKRV